MSRTKKIVSITPVSPGSNPDIDSDFNTRSRDQVLKYVSDLYGHKNVSNIVTFGTLAAKGAFKSMCTIYDIPFPQANRLVGLIPGPVDGRECTLEDVFDKDSDRYSEGEDFRAALASSEWGPVIKGALAIEGRIKSTGVHACGVLISSKPLDETIPLQVRKSDGRVISQWTYPECEALGLIKMDFLGLDTVDIIQRTVELVLRSGRKAPNMLEVIHGPMDDPQVYQLFQEGRTVGVFQFGSELVRDLLKQMRPTEFNDLSACTALARPGPMGMGSHTLYADRKNGRARIEPIHPDFVGSELEDILGKTYGLCVYQEQIMQISNRIAGMTLQEGDKLRKAMGKKKADVMMEMKPRFIDGGVSNGFSSAAMNALWNMMEPFAKYGFNKAHSVAYAMTAYQAAYLKTHFPVEFMAALIGQTIDNRDKTLNHIREAKRMGLRLGTADVNLSDVEVSPDFSGGTGCHILYGLGGVKGVSAETASRIVEERAKGLFTSVQDMVERCMSAGVTSTKVFENLALAGAFDSIDRNRRRVLEMLPDLVGEARRKSTAGASLFDSLGMGEPLVVQPPEVADFPYAERLKKEADMVGLYLSGHPLDHVERNKVPVSQLLEARRRTKATLMVAVAGVEVKKTRRGKTYLLSLDDGTGFITARLAPEVLARLDKHEAASQVRKLFEAGETTVPAPVLAKCMQPSVRSLPAVEANGVYSVDLMVSPGFDGSMSARVTSIEPVVLSQDGSLPVRVRFTDDGSQKARKLIEGLPAAVARKLPGEATLLASVVPAGGAVSEDALLAYAVDVMKKDAGGRRTWPSREQVPQSYRERLPGGPQEGVCYKDTGARVERSARTARLLERFVGFEGYDMGSVSVQVPSEV